MARRLDFAGVLFYLYEPGLSRLVRPAKTRMNSGLTYLAEWDEEFRAGREADLYQYGGGLAAEADRFVDLRDRIDWDRLVPFARPPKTGPVYSVPLDLFARGITYNADGLAEIGLTPPFATWEEFLRACEACRRARYKWPIAMPNSEKSPWATIWWDRILDRRLRCRYRDAASLARAVAAGRFRARDAANVAAAKLLKRLSAYFIWYANTYTSIQTKPFYFSPRPQCLFRPGDFRRMRLDNDRRDRDEFPFREGTMPIPECDRGTWGRSLSIAITRACERRGKLKDALALVRRLLSPAGQRELTRWGNTRPVVRGIDPPKVIAHIPFRAEQPLVAYRGLSPDARRAWFKGFQDFVEPAGKLPAFLKSVDRALVLER